MPEAALCTRISRGFEKIANTAKKETTVIIKGFKVSLFIDFEANRAITKAMSPTIKDTNPNLLPVKHKLKIVNNNKKPVINLYLISFNTKISPRAIGMHIER